MIAAKGGSTKRFHARFRMGVGDSPEAHEIPDDLLRLDAVAMPISPEDIAAYSPKALCVVELRAAAIWTSFAQFMLIPVESGTMFQDGTSPMPVNLT